MNEIVRPEGFPLSEIDLRSIKSLRVSEVVDGRHRETYSEWALSPTLVPPSAAYRHLLDQARRALNPRQ